MARSTESTESRPGRTAGAAGTAGRRERVANRNGRGRTATILNAAPEGHSYEREVDWGRLALVGAGVTVGVALGAVVALLIAPRSGEETREMLGEAMSDRWQSLRSEVDWLARRGRKQGARGLTRGRWAAEDARDRIRRKLAG